MQYSTIRQLAIITFNLRNSRITEDMNRTEDPIIYHSRLQSDIDLDSINILNRNLLLPLILPNSLHISLLNFSFQLNSFTNLEFYTDGSLSRDDDIPIMGYGWLFTTDLTDLTKSNSNELLLLMK